MVSVLFVGKSNRLVSLKMSGSKSSFQTSSSACLHLDWIDFIVKAECATKCLFVCI